VYSLFVGEWSTLSWIGRTLGAARSLAPQQQQQQHGLLSRILTEYRITASRATSRSRSPALDCVKSVHLG